MATHVLERQQFIPAPLNAVFAFFKNPYALEGITPPWMHFHVLDATDADVREGTRIRYRLRWRVFPMRWESRITQYRENVMFADEMLRGPYAWWYHTHEFRDVGDGTEMVDRVEYRLPFGPLGSLMHRATVRSQLNAIFDYRASAIADVFASQETSPADHVILFAHGSTDPAWRRPHDQILQQLRAEVGHTRVSVAFLERSPPTLTQAMADAYDAGARSIAILPVFVATGVHLRQDLPRLVDEASKGHPELQVTIGPAVGEDRRFQDLVRSMAVGYLGRRAVVDPPRR